MKRTQGIAALVAGTLIVLALLAVFAVELSDNQSQSRRSLESQAHQRATLVSGLLDELFAQASRVPAAEVKLLGTPTVPNRVVQGLNGQSDYTVLLNAHGGVLAHSSGFDAQARRSVLTGAALKLVMGGHPWGLGNQFSNGHSGTVDFARRVATSRGERILISGSPTAQLSALITGELSRVPGVARQHQLMVDGNGVVIGSTVADRPAGYVFHTATQLRALHGPSGIVDSPQNVKRYFDSVPLNNSPWRLILSVPASQFFASVSGLRHYLPWVIFVAFGLVAIAALLLVRRSIRASERIRTTNAQLTDTNAELASAHVSLEEAVGALAESNDALERSNDELERQARELVRSNTELDQFASIASHDLQEPLRKVRTFTERISETEAENLSERGADYLRRANASAERMQTLIEDLLRFSRVSTQGRPFSPVDLAKVVEDVLDDLSEQVTRTGARVEVSGLPTINADPPQMRQLMQNLISNAIKFRREDVAPVVRVESRVESGWVTMTVADNGIGFDPQYSRRIFRVFERLHGRGTYPGTGIGLALCRKIAERHGGTVVANGVPGEGSTFTVTMQTERTEAVSDAPPEPGNAGGSTSREEPYVTA
jgi:signal transduction histidine kinase